MLHGTTFSMHVTTIRNANGVTWNLIGWEPQDKLHCESPYKFFHVTSS